MRFTATDLAASYHVERPFRAPYHTGSLVRGLLGRALRATGCAAATPCPADCTRPGECAYSRLFEPPLPLPAPPDLILRGATQAPTRLLPLLPAPRARAFACGETFTIALRVLGPHHPGDGDRLRAALEHLAALPIGRDAGRVAFASLSQSGPSQRPITLASSATTTDTGSSALRLRFETPAWIERQRQLARDLDFPTLFAAIARRLATLAFVHGEWSDDDEAERHRLYDLAPLVRVTHRDLRALRWERQPEDSDHTTPLRGLLGQLDLAGPLAPFRPWLAAAAIAHIGKSVSFGLGRMEVE